MQPTIVPDAIAIIMTIWVCYANYKQIVVTPDILLIWKVAIGVFFSDKTGITEIVRTGLKSKLTKTLPVILFGLLMISPSSANADILNPISPTNQKLSASTPIIDSGNILTDASTIVNYLGVQEGYAYNFELKKWDVISGATIITYAPWNLDLGIAMLDTDGVAGTIDWNVGKFLPVSNVPVMQYFSYLYVSAGAGAEEDANANWKFCPIVGAKFKFTF